MTVFCPKHCNNWVPPPSSPSMEKRFELEQSLGLRDTRFHTASMEIAIPGNENSLSTYAQLLCKLLPELRGSIGYLSTGFSF